MFMPEGQEPTRITIRTAAWQRELIDHAAEQVGRSREGFVLDAACREAEDLLLDQVYFSLDGAAFDQFRAWLDNPPEPNEALHRLMRTKAPWE